MYFDIRDPMRQASQEGTAKSIIVTSKSGYFFKELVYFLRQIDEEMVSRMLENFRCKTPSGTEKYVSARSHARSIKDPPK